MRPAIFLDRDGVINKVLLSNGKPFSPRKFKDFKLLPGVEKALSLLKEMGLVSIVVTNQPDIARGLMDIEELRKMHELMQERLPIDDIMVCSHDDADGCQCRKPKPGMLIEAVNRWSVDLGTSFLVGDTWKDIRAGEVIGCKTVLIDMPYNRGVSSNFKAKNLKEAAEIIRLSLDGNRQPIAIQE